MQGACLSVILNLFTFKIATIEDNPPVLTSALSHNYIHHLHHEILMPNIGIDGSASTIMPRGLGVGHSHNKSGWERAH